MITVNNVKKSFNSKTVLNDVSFSLPIERCLGIIGKNGSGKTTLFKAMLDFFPIDGGTIKYDGIDVTNKFPSKLKKEVGVFINDDMLVNELTGYQYLKFISSIFNVMNMEKKIQELFEVFMFEDYSKFKLEIISNYSLGMKRKISLMASLVNSPKYLFLDEPFNGLDYDSNKSFIEYITNYKKKSHVLISSHMIPFIELISDDLLWLDKGKVNYYGPKTGFSLEVDDIDFITHSTI